ncbi:Vacuolar-sorting protein dot2 [Cyphellophora attinorum]|uniref:Vacuolar-sorting protein SNF8 n=1 Tax=Cyphellophora attinorum TaxID=1664694 RepID=A0A0N1NYZ4_9EURO|nr:Vacuolar-sorting protein dot2 [Phialophora attinorum]KPI36512.1 Vacuolar-sorting protein dot2 [Phialophora attinorum]
MSTRRGVGLGAFTTNRNLTQSYSTLGTHLKSTQSASLATQLEVFQSLLHNFALEHSSTIKSNPQFRTQFAQMCVAIGVDPLAGSYQSGSASATTGKGVGGLWAKVLGHDVNDFYFSIAVRIVELCLTTRSMNGGLLGVKECREALTKATTIGNAFSSVSEDDILRAVKSLEPLGSGFKVVEIGGRAFIRSVPKELNTDQSTVLEVLALLQGGVSVGLLRDNLGWEEARCVTVLEDLLADSLVWVDYQCREAEYWSPQGLVDDD